MLNIFGKERGVKRDGFTLGKFFVVIAVLSFLFALPERGSGMDQFKVVGYAPNWYGTGYLDRIDYASDLRVCHSDGGGGSPTFKRRRLHDRAGEKGA